MRSQQERNSEGGGNSESPNAFNEILNGLAKSVQKRMENRETREAFSDGLKRAQQGGGAGPSFGRSNMIPDSLPTEAPAISSSAITFVVIIIVVAVVAIFMTRSLRQRMTAAVSRYASVIAHANSFRLTQIQNAADLIRAVDRFVFWKFGYGAHWWHGGRVRNQLIESHPQLRTEIGDLLLAYEQARYAPASTLDQQRLDRTANTLKNLVEIVKARELSQLKDSRLDEADDSVILASEADHSRESS